jgi:hypothetical protein
MAWMYFVPYESDLQSTLDKLKEREFRAGRYNPVLLELPLHVDRAGPAPVGENVGFPEGDRRELT